jgi:hypothetical protein
MTVALLAGGTGGAKLAAGNLLPGVTMSGAAAVLGAVATIIMIWLSFIDFPSGADRKVGVYLALVAAIVITVGAYMSAQEEPTARR